LTGLIAVAAILVIASVAVAIVANVDLDRQKKEVAKLEQMWRDMAGQLEQEEERHRLAQGTLEFTERRKRETEDEIRDDTAEIERLEEEERRAEAEGVDGEEEVHHGDPHSITMARDPRREVI
jgi:flagellar biosynthesis/type III secretory pathway M-ring protein FliF/YscJ